MKLSIKFLVFIVVLGMVGLFFIKNPDWRPLLQVDDFVPQAPSIMKSWNDITQGDLEVGSKTITGKSKVYRWQDSAGTWQYSDEPPVSGQADLIWIDPDTNLIKGSKHKDTQQSVVVDTAISTVPSIPLPLTLAPDKVSKLIDDAKAASDLMQQRNKDLETFSSGSGQ
jgi:hypothetical protein